MLKINEYFLSIQGEGTRIGRSSLFIRLSGCNLRCVFRNEHGVVQSKCDTPYTSFCNEKTNITENDIIDYIMSNKHKFTDIVITGGEPLLQQDNLVILLKDISKIIPNTYITIETNGTITPSIDILRLVDLWSISPKLSNSVPIVEDGVSEALCDKHKNSRVNIEAIHKMIIFNETQLKFVYNGEYLIKEINQIKNDIVDYIDKTASININPLTINKIIMLMPEGSTLEAITKNSLPCIETCLENGWTFSPRLHIMIWGDKRGV